MYQFAPHLRREGINVQFRPLLSDNQLSARMRGEGYSVWRTALAYVQRLEDVLRRSRFDVLWIERELFPWMPFFLDGLATAGRRPYIVDYDDAAFHQYDAHPNPWVRAVLKNKIAEVMRRADAVCVGNPYLRWYAEMAGARAIVDLPSVVDTSLYRPSDSLAQSERIRIGWIGTPATAPYLAEISPALRAVVDSGGSSLTVVGAPDTDVGVAGATMLPWSEASEIQAIQAFDIGIMPVHAGRFEQGKCGYKLVQYMACGLPTVASPVGVNAIIVEQGRTGFLATSEREWIDSLMSLVSDRQLRRTMGAAGRLRAVERYSVAYAAPRLVAAIKGVAGSRPVSLTSCSNA